MITDKKADPDHVRFQDVCARLDAAMATAKLTPSQKKPFEVCISVAQGWSKLRIASSMKSAASKVFKGDHLQHVATVQASLLEARAILKTEPAEFNLSDHCVHVDVVHKMMDTIEKEATNIATDTLFTEFQDLEKKIVNFARLMSLLPSPQDKKKYLAFFKQKDQNIKDITAMIDKLEKQLSSLKERVEKFGVVTGSDDFKDYDAKMDEFKNRLHDGDSAVSCQALVMLLANPKTREPGGSSLRALLDQVLVNFVDGENHRAHICPEDILQEGRSIAAAFDNKDEAEDDQPQDGTGHKNAPEQSDTAVPSDTAEPSTRSGKGGKQKDKEAGAEHGKRKGGKGTKKKPEEPGAEDTKDGKPKRPKKER